MADVKITALAVLTAADPINDAIPIVDVSDITMAASGTTKRISVNNILSSSPTASGALTVTGLVTAGSATITGDLTVDTSTLKVDSTNDNVIVGATSAIGGGRFSVQADLSAKQGICVKNSAASYGASNNLIRFTNSSDASIGGITHPAVTSLGIWGVTETKFLLGGAAATAMTLNSSGNLAFPTGKGIDFSAVTGGTGTATGNVLNDYEEGTFTPVVQGSTTAGVGVYSTQTGRYTKIGRLVTVEIYIVWSAHTGTGNLQIGGLPFTVNASHYSAATIGLANSIPLSASNTIAAFNQVNAAYINVIQLPVGGGSFTDVPMDTAASIVLNSTYSV